MSNKQSSIRWVIEELERFELGTSEFCSKTAIINHADRMHKEEIEDAYDDGWHHNNEDKYNPIKHYNERFEGGNK